MKRKNYWIDQVVEVFGTTKFKGTIGRIVRIMPVKVEIIEDGTGKKCVVDKKFVRTYLDLDRLMESSLRDEMQEDHELYLAYRHFTTLLRRHRVNTMQERVQLHHAIALGVMT